MADWRRRLFGQRLDGSTPPARGRDVGFVGRAGRVVIDDDWRLADFQQAETARARFYASYGWFMKLARNGERAFEELGDDAVRSAVEDALDHASASLLIMAGDLRSKLGSIVDADTERDECQWEETPTLDLGSWTLDSIADLNRPSSR